MKATSLSYGYITNTVFSSRTYWLADKENSIAWLVDCGDVERVLKQLPQHIEVVGVLLTHVHYDHIYGLNFLIEKMPKCRVYTNSIGKTALVDPRHNFSRYHIDVDDFIFKYPDNVVVVDEGDKVELFDTVFAGVYYTPGHDDTCLCYSVDDKLFTGDALIPGIKTVTTFPHSDKKKAYESEKHIKQILDGKTICPGHTIE